MLKKLFRLFQEQGASEAPIYIHEVDEEELDDTAHYTMSEEEFDYVHMYYLH